MRFALVDDKKELRDHVAMLLGEFAAEQRLHYKLDCFASGEDFLGVTSRQTAMILSLWIFLWMGWMVWKRRSRFANLTAM